MSDKILKNATMQGTLEDFKAHAEECNDEFDVDRVCFTWLRLTCMEHGKAGEHASGILRIIEEMLE